MTDRQAGDRIILLAIVLPTIFSLGTPREVECLIKCTLFAFACKGSDFLPALLTFYTSLEVSWSMLIFPLTNVYSWN